MSSFIFVLVYDFIINNNNNTNTSRLYDPGWSNAGRKQDRLHGDWNVGSLLRVSGLANTFINYNMFNKRNQPSK